MSQTFVEKSIEKVVTTKKVLRVLTVCDITDFEDYLMQNEMLSNADSLIKMECYTTPWPLWRESRNLWHFIELSFAFGVPLSLFLPYCSLFSVFRRVIARLQSRGTRAAISAFTQVKTEKREQ